MHTVYNALCRPNQSTTVGDPITVQEWRQTVCTIPAKWYVAEWPVISCNNTSVASCQRTSSMIWSDSNIVSKTWHANARACCGWSGVCSDVAMRSITTSPSRPHFRCRPLRESSITRFKQYDLICKDWLDRSVTNHFTVYGSRRTACPDKTMNKALDVHAKVWSI